VRPKNSTVARSVARVIRARRWKGIETAVLIARFFEGKAEDLV